MTSEQFPRRFKAHIDYQQRPYVFAAKHSHAFYESEGNFYRLIVLRDKTNQGEVWHTNNQIEIISDALTNPYLEQFNNSREKKKENISKIIIASKHLPWMAFKGVWGKQRSSPIGPLQKDAWKAKYEMDIPIAHEASDV